MLKNIARLECKIGERIYHFTCDNDSPIVELKEALFQFCRYVGHIEDNAKAQFEQQQKQQENKVEETPPEA